MSFRARSTSRSVSRTHRFREDYFWPNNQLNGWILVMLAAGGVLIGVFATFIQAQKQLRLGIPW